MLIEKSLYLITRMYRQYRILAFFEIAGIFTKNILTYYTDATPLDTTFITGPEVGDSNRTSIPPGREKN